MSPRRLIRTWVIGVVAVTMSAVGFDVVSAAASGPLKAIPSCSRLAGWPVVYHSGSGNVIVRRGTVPGDGGTHDWACSRSGAVQASPLGTVPEGGFAPGVTVHEFLSAGPWLVDVASSRRGWRSPFDLTGARVARREHHEIELTDVADGSAATTAAGTRVQAHLSVLPALDGQRIAAVVWTQVAPRSLITLRSLIVRDATRHGASSTVAIHPPVTGKIDPHSVQLKGLRVSFTQDGRYRSFKLGA